MTFIRINVVINSNSISSLILSLFSKSIFITVDPGDKLSGIKALGFTQSISEVNDLTFADNTKLDNSNVSNILEIIIKIDKNDW